MRSRYIHYTTNLHLTSCGKIVWPTEPQAVIPIIYHLIHSPLKYLGHQYAFKLAKRLPSTPGQLFNDITKHYLHKIFEVISNNPNAIFLRPLIAIHLERYARIIEPEQGIKILEAYAEYFHFYQRNPAIYKINPQTIYALVNTLKNSKSKNIDINSFAIQWLLAIPNAKALQFQFGH